MSSTTEADVSDSVEHLWVLIDEYVAAEGVELDDLEVVGRGPGRLLRVTVDADGGIGVDRIAAISRGLSRLVEGHAPESYALEVTSPGLERKLRRPAHYHKSVGRVIRVKTTEPVDGATGHRGVLREVSDDGFVVDVDGGVRRIGFGQVAAARTIFIWEKAAKPGKRH